jgi:uncharacterized protein YciI
MHYLLTYEKARDHAVRELAWQAAHRDHVFAAVDRGELLLGGPLDDPLDGSQSLLFRADSIEAVKSFASSDPYVVHGIVTRWQVRTWHTVVGKDAAEPLPESHK